VFARKQVRGRSLVDVWGSGRAAFGMLGLQPVRQAWD